jgi:hypothetical protein
LNEQKTYIDPYILLSGTPILLLAIRIISAKLGYIQMSAGIFPASPVSFIDDPLSPPYSLMVWMTHRVGVVQLSVLSIGIFLAWSAGWLFLMAIKPLAPRTIRWRAASGAWAAAYISGIAALFAGWYGVACAIALSLPLCAVAYNTYQLQHRATLQRTALILCFGAAASFVAFSTRLAQDDPLVTGLAITTIMP